MEETQEWQKPNEVRSDVRAILCRASLRSLRVQEMYWVCFTVAVKSFNLLIGTCQVPLQDPALTQLCSGCSESIFPINSTGHRITSLTLPLLPARRGAPLNFHFFMTECTAMGSAEEQRLLQQVSCQADVKLAIFLGNFLCWLPPPARTPSKVTNQRPTNPLIELALHADVTRHNRGKEWLLSVLKSTKVFPSTFKFSTFWPTQTRVFPWGTSKIRLKSDQESFLWETSFLWGTPQTMLRNPQTENLLWV